MKSLKNTFNKTDSSHLITVGNTVSLTPSFSIATTTQADPMIFLNLLYIGNTVSTISNLGKPVSVRLTAKRNINSPVKKAKSWGP